MLYYYLILGQTVNLPFLLSLVFGKWSITTPLGTAGELQCLLVNRWSTAWVDSASDPQENALLISVVEPEPEL